ncbi:MAG: response regulator [Anaerolineae bacterium]|nr:response regulator [Anaerolineae bacterium]
MSKTILYIEDNPNDQRFVQKVLGRKGFTLLIAGDGETGIKLAQEHNPDLILVDLHMPGLDGLETARRLRAVECCAKTIIIALTAYAEKYKRALYLEAGFTDYQQKQAGIKPLLALVARHLGE